MAVWARRSHLASASSAPRPRCPAVCRPRRRLCARACDRGPGRAERLPRGFPRLQSTTTNHPPIPPPRSLEQHAQGRHSSPPAIARARALTPRAGRRTGRSTVHPEPRCSSPTVAPKTSEPRATPPPPPQSPGGDDGRKISGSDNVDSDKSRHRQRQPHRRRPHSGSEPTSGPA